MKLNLKKFLPYLGGFLGAVVLATAAFVGGYWYRGKVAEQPQPTRGVSTSPSPSPTIEAEAVDLDHEEIDTYGWDTSHSEGLGLTIKHPKGWYAMDYTFWIGGVGGVPAFGLTYPLKVDLNEYQQNTLEGEKFRIHISKIADGKKLESEKAINESLNNEADSNKEYLGFDEVVRKKYTGGDNFTALLNYNYIDYGPQRQLDYIDGYLLSGDRETYRIFFSLVKKGEGIDNFYLGLLEKIASTIKFP